MIIKKIEKFRKIGIIKLFFILLVTNVLWSISVGILYYIFGWKCPGGLRLTGEIITKNLILMPAATFVEEMLFRWGPMLIFFGVLYSLKKIMPSLPHPNFKYKLLLILVIVASSSLGFGLMHGGLLNIFIHGILGVFCYLFYLRILFDSKFFGKWQMKPLLGAFIYHLAYNCFFYGIQAILS